MRAGGRAVDPAPALDAIEPGGSAPLRGLSEPEAAARAAAGRANVDPARQRSDADVVRANTLTFFNAVLGSMIAALLVAGEFRDGLFVGATVAANVAVATLQELYATRRLRALRALTAAHATVVRDGRARPVPAADVVEGDLVRLAPGDQVVADGRVVDGLAEVDESLLTGESDAVHRRTGDALRSGSFCVAGSCTYTAERVGAGAYALRLTADARTLVRRRTPLSYRLQRLVRVLLLATALLAGVLLIQFLIEGRGFAEAMKAATATVTTVVPVGLILGTTVVIAVAALRVSRAGALVQDIYAVEALNYVDVVAFDKTGTLTSNRLALEGIDWAPGEEALAGWLGAFAQATAGESRTAGALGAALAPHTNGAHPVGRVPFSSARRWSAVTLERAGERRTLLLGAPESLLAGAVPGDVPWQARTGTATAAGWRTLLLAEAPALPRPDAPLAGQRPLALLRFADELRPEIREALALMSDLGIRPKVVSGDHPATVAALLRQLGLEPGATVSGAEWQAMDEGQRTAAADAGTIFGRIEPRQKAEIVAALQRAGRFVAVVGDGANDVHALQRADVAVAMASGTSITRGVAGIVLLDDSFAALIRGIREATFSLGNTLRLSKLFIAKSVYAYLLILVTNMLGLDFPFLPRQGSVTAIVTLGIPAVFISIGAPPRVGGAGFARDVMRFALPAGIALAAATIPLQFTVEALTGAGIEQARTLVSLVIGFVGLAYVVEVLGLEDARLRHPTRPLLTIALAVALGGALVLTVEVGWIRSFFAFTTVSRVEWVVVGIASSATLVVQYTVTRWWREILDLALGRPDAAVASRGREPSEVRRTAA